MSVTEFPIGVVTKNRAIYLATTLRSLSATDQPSGVQLTVFDDGSDDPVTRRYLDTTGEVALSAPYTWPRGELWDGKGMSFLSDLTSLRGIAGSVDVRRTKSSEGVVNASNRALRTLFEEHPAASHVCLLQDDLVFNPDWYTRLLQRANELGAAAQTTVLAGCMISYTGWARAPKSDDVAFVTAQCLLVPRRLWEEIEFFHKSTQKRLQFDQDMCHWVKERGYDLRLLLPACCQHIGVVSEVRPDGEQFLNGVGRFCHYAAPPYAWPDGEG